LIKNIAWKFQQVALWSLVKHAVLACKQYDVTTLGAVGGVAASSKLQWLLIEGLAKNIIDVNLLMPAKRTYCTDNWAMIGVIGHLMHK
jgi:N6-L-threonylcarbamoyladenine synthase